MFGGFFQGNVSEEHLSHQNVEAECRACLPLLCLSSRLGGKKTGRQKLSCSNSRFQFSASEAGYFTPTPICEFGPVYFLLIKLVFGAGAARLEPR